MQTRVGIVGAGPAGLTLALLLAHRGIDAVVLEAKSRDYVERRVRAGVLEHNTVLLFEELEVAARLHREALRHSGVLLRRPGQTVRIDLEGLTGRPLTVYGQQEVVKDLIAAALERGIDIRFDVSDVVLQDFTGIEPRIGFSHQGESTTLGCDFIVGCDGSHGLSRSWVASGSRDEYEREYPFAWLGVLVDAEPATDELIYAWHPRGFALHSMRSRRVSRLYLQVPADESLGQWSDEQIWAELGLRLGAEGWNLNTGPVLERSITPMRSYVCEPMRRGRLFLAGDAAHIVPPTGAKGLNLAVNDVRLLAAALRTWYERGDQSDLVAYSERALRRVWRAQEFSSYMTTLLHALDDGPYAERLQLSRFEYLERSEAAQRSLAENYVGLPAKDDF
ncbi:MAG TPA: 4-hydroxybenzoate 3-monooxygenase [Acidimicrobiales bacterium]|nr:4-hydroxybenzoate 3-monooxygenase [Acidimicrobiales bacterium]HUA95415.1 4-hydroxybenzoate 3-monooxygenase [Acidimicrobiales bacterium]